MMSATPHPTTPRHPGAGRGPVAGGPRDAGRSPDWAPASAGVTVMLGLMAAALLSTSATAQTQADMNEQVAASYKAADAAMNAQWPRTYAAMKRRDATARDGFGYAAATLASQRAWLAYRDKQCTIEGGEFAGGSLQPMARLQCLARLTKERTTQLKDLMWQR